MEKPPGRAGADPRDFITEQAFSVASELLGLPLATPRRRAWGILIDLCCIALLSNATGVLLAAAAAWVLFRTVSKRWGATRRVWVRVPLGAGAAVIGFALLLTAWNSASGLAARVIGGDEQEESAAEQVAAQEMDEEEVREMVEATLPDSAWAPEVAREVAAALEGRHGLAAADAPTPAVSDSLAAAYAAARAHGDSALELRAQFGGALAADELSARNRRIERLEARNQRLAEELGETRGRRGVIAWLRAAADDLGLGFGWSALYFTAFLVLGKGRTPGKRIARTRVVRLDGRPITWWVAFERFGGYVAGVFTGLLDYFLLVRDPNRQVLHDKIVNTVVIRE